MFQGFAGAALGALANLGGGLFSAGGASAANAANMQQQNMWNQQALNAQMAQHAQNTAFMEDSQAHDIFVRNMGNQWAERQTKQAQDYNTSMFERNIAENYKFSNTAYQRAMTDMKAAGLNPILAYQQGGASTPTSSAPSSPTPSGGSGSGITASSSGGGSYRAANVMNDKEAFGRAIGNAVSSAVDVMKTVQGVDLMKEQEKLTKQQEETEKYRQRNLHMDSAKKIEETHKTNAEIDNTKAMNAVIKAQGKTAYHESNIKGREEQDTSRYGSKATPGWLERVLRDIQGYVEQNGGRLPDKQVWD